MKKHKLSKSSNVINEQIKSISSYCEIRRFFLSSEIPIGCDENSDNLIESIDRVGKVCSSTTSCSRYDKSKWPKEEIFIEQQLEEHFHRAKCRRNGLGRWKIRKDMMASSPQDPILHQLQFAVIKAMTYNISLHLSLRLLFNNRCILQQFQYSQLFSDH